MISETDIRNILRHRCSEAGSQRAYCVMHGLEETYVSAVLAGRISPGRKLAEKLGYAKKTVFIALQQADTVK